jgi:hypothetical protein
MENETLEEKKCIRSMVLSIVFGILIGFLLGFLFHDTLVEHNLIKPDIKSWYPR